MPSPYTGLPDEQWIKVTQKLISMHPLKPAVIIGAVLDSWDSIFESRIGKHGIQIGKDIFPVPQLMGAFLHELIPRELAAKHPKTWRGSQSKIEKDLVRITKPKFSIEVKTSSHKSAIYANRSYAQPQSMSSLAKGKDGYYLAVNFEKFEKGGGRPRIRQIRFGWLDHSDWIAQTASTGQQARLRPITYQSKLLTIYTVKN